MLNSAAADDGDDDVDDGEDDDPSHDLVSISLPLLFHPDFTGIGTVRCTIYNPQNVAQFQWKQKYIILGVEFPDSRKFYFNSKWPGTKGRVGCWCVSLTLPFFKLVWS